MNDLTLPVELPAPVIRAAYHRLPVEGKVIVASIDKLKFLKEHLEGVTFYRRDGKQVKPKPDEKTGYITFHSGYVVKPDNTAPIPCLVFIYIVGKVKKGQQ